MYSKSSSAQPLSPYQPNVNQTNNNNNNRRNSPDDSELPDLSHLSEAERKIIEAVLERQRADEKISPISEKSNTLPLRLVLADTICLIFYIQLKNNQFLVFERFKS